MADVVASNGTLKMTTKCIGKAKLGSVFQLEKYEKKMENPISYNSFNGGMEVSHTYV